MNAALKLIQFDRAKVLYTIDANTGRAIKPLAKQHTVIQICQAWDNGAIADGEYNVVYNIQPEDLVAVLFKHLRGINIHRLAVLYFQASAFNNTLEALHQQVSRDQMKIVAEESFPPGVRDFRTVLLKMKEREPETLLILSFSPEQEIIARQLTEIGWKIPITTSEMFDISSNRRIFEGAYYSSMLDLHGRFAKKFEATYKRQTQYHGYSYDILSLVNAAYKKCGGDIEKLPTAIQSMTPFNGIVGEAVNHNGIFKYQPFLAKVVDGMPLRISD